PNVEQSASTIMGLEFMMIGLPAIMMAISGVIYQRYYHLHEGFDKSAVESEVKGTASLAQA
ncbi:melibiose:sodium transporter MelB, partial [Vibrio vulnificus]